MTLSKRTPSYLLVVALALVLALANAAPVAAQGEQPDTPGIIHGMGTHFEVTDSDWLNVTVDSSAEIYLFLSSSPEIVNMTVEAASDATSAEIALGGLEANTTYWKYEDGGVDGVEFTADASGNYIFTQDLSEAHNILIQPGQGTVYIDNTGGSCASIGTWDSTTKTCTLTQDVNDSIYIATSGVTLDGAGHQVNLPSGGGWVRVQGANHTVKNLMVNGNYFSGNYGVHLYDASNCTVTNVTVSNAYLGILAEQSSDNTISDNTISEAAYGVVLFLWSNYNTLSGNTVSPHSTSYDYVGVYVFSASSGNTITGNTISNFNSGLSIHGQAWPPNHTSQNNTVYHNNFIDNTYQISLPEPHYNTGNVFHLAAPDGGNYYTVFDEPAEGCSDGDGDGFCDSPYTFTEGQDGLPWTTQDGWEGPTDDTPPEITPNVSGTLGDNGWYVSDVTVSWTVSDPESEVSETSGCDETVVTTDTGGDTLTCTAASAGGTASESVTIKRDATAPTASASASPGSNANGWNNTDVTVIFSGDDGTGSGIDSCSPPVVLSSEGVGGSVSGTCTDLAGNISAPATASGINIDKTAPTLSITTPEPYDIEPVGTALDFSASDALSGLEADAVATLTGETETWEMASGEQPGVGVYTVVVEATDQAGNTATSEPRLLVIYNPEGGFVTGGGWIYSDPGAYVPDPTLEGKANFGFVSKYKKGATTPTGQTEFQFHVADLNFHSSSYDWLVVNQGGSNAQFKGAGTINGEGDYRFMLWAGDGEPDTFRIKIWEEDEDGNETVTYDNGSDQEIGGGSIVVHTSKK